MGRVPCRALQGRARTAGRASCSGRPFLRSSPPARTHQQPTARQQRPRRRSSQACRASSGAGDDSWLDASGEDASDTEPFDDFSDYADLAGSAEDAPDAGLFDDLSDAAELADAEPDLAGSGAEEAESLPPGVSALAGPGELSDQDRLFMRGVPVEDLPPEPLRETDISAAPPRSLQPYVKKKPPPAQFPPGPFDGPDVEYGPWEEVQEGDEDADEDLYYHGLFADGYESDASDCDDPLPGPEVADPQEELLEENGLRVPSLFRESKFARVRPARRACTYIGVAAVQRAAATARARRRPARFAVMSMRVTARGRARECACGDMLTRGAPADARKVAAARGGAPRGAAGR